jgi:hypothetical protein
MLKDEASGANAAPAKEEKKEAPKKEASKPAAKTEAPKPTITKVVKEAPKAQPDLADHSYIIERQLKPEARTDIVTELSDLKVKPTSMIDISDGLASECFHLMAASGLGVRIYEDKLPIDP